MGERKQEELSSGHVTWLDLSIEEIQLRMQHLPEELIPQIIHILQNDPRKGIQKLIIKRKKELLAMEQERERLKRLAAKETHLHNVGYQHIGGIDEAGRGPLAGPVVAACVILPKSGFFSGLNDSKKLTPQKRAELEVEIKAKAIAWAVGVVNHKQIDKMNIYQATKLAMFKAAQKLTPKPDYLLLDAMTIAFDIPQESIIHGDCVCASIAAASIIAKTYRDRIMEVLDDFYPAYGFGENKGYGTPRHLEALKKCGASPVHRMSFLRNLF